MKRPRSTSRGVTLVRSLLTVALIVFTAYPILPAHAVTPDNLWFIFLERGKPTPDDKAQVAEMQRGHLDNFKRLFAEQKLFAAGPMQDPSGNKRGIVVVRAASSAEINNYFASDQLVREGHLTVNAAPAIAHRPLVAEGIDPNSIEEVRIIQIIRSVFTGNGDTTKADDAFLQSLVDKGQLGAWYSLTRGPIRDVLFSRTTDSKIRGDNRGQTTVFTTTPSAGHRTVPACSVVPTHRESHAAQAPLQSAAESVCPQAQSCHWLRF